jgi:hypothetical protein
LLHFTHGVSQYISEVIGIVKKEKKAIFIQYK